VPAACFEFGRGCEVAPSVPELETGLALVKQAAGTKRKAAASPSFLGKPHSNRRGNFAKQRGAFRHQNCHTASMHPSLVTALRARSPHMRRHWETLLRAEPVATPLGNPDAMVHLIDSTLEEILATLENPAQQCVEPDSERSSSPFECFCRRNPLIAYFAAGNQALCEGLVLTQVACASLEPIERDASFEELNRLLQQTGKREIEAFCGLCQLRSGAITGASASVSDKS
jgi:hypothetical protein